MSKSADGKGRTIWDILTGANKADERPIELQHYNPLKATIGKAVWFDHPDYADVVNFFITNIVTYETKIGKKKFFHVDYVLEGLDKDANKVHIRIRLVPDNNTTDELGHKIQVLRLYDEMEYDEEFKGNVLNNESGEFQVNQDKGNDLKTPITYWRVEDVKDAYHATRNTISADAVIDKKEITYWDYSRIGDEENGTLEFLWVEMDNETGYFMLYRGKEVQPFQVSLT